MVAERTAQVGEYIAERTVVATIVQMNPLKLRTGVQEKHAGVVRADQPVEFRVESFGDTVFTGKVAYVGPSLDPTMRTFAVEALVDNHDQRLKPGFFAKGVILTRRDEGVLAVPDAAVSTLAGVASVYIVKDSKITQQTVTLGVRDKDLWEVVEGLKGDETLAASRLNELATGVAVELDTEDGGGGGDNGRGRRGRGRGGEGGEGGGRRGGQRGGGQ
jgi:RND family efflux transporter MFP subunit